MSRTLRTKPKGKGTARDGEDLRVSRLCGHHNQCPYCLSNRTHATLRRMLIDGPSELETRRLK